MIRTAVGIDIGGTNTKIGIVDKSGHCYAHTSIVTPTSGKIEDFIKNMSLEIENLKTQLSPNIQLVGIGIGAPNANYYKGTIEHAPNLAWKGVIEFAEMFKKYYKLPIFLTNDANAAAIGEMVYGGAKGMNDFIVITLGTGLGSGLVANGKLIYGHDGFAGELGHTTVDPYGRHCACGKRGCLETYVSATGIKRTIYKLIADFTEPSLLKDISFNQLSPKTITDAAQAGDKIALEAFEQTGQILGLKLADTVAYTSPQAIFLFGGLAQSGDFLLTPTKYHMEKNLMAIFKNKVKILLSELSGANAAIMGASALVWNELGE